MMTAHHVSLIVAIAACAVGAAADVRTGNIPNWLTLGLLGVAPVVRGAVAFHHDPTWVSAVGGVGLSLLGAIASALVPLLLHRAGGLGMGDVKLFAALGAACGTFAAACAQTYAYIAALPYALVVLLRRRGLRAALGRVAGLWARPRQGSPAAGGRGGFTEVRFAPAILAGMCLAAWTQWWP
jgi:prepilin peptidase CpaA